MMNRLIGDVYMRYQSLVGEIDIKDEGLKPWQVTELHRLAQEAESVLSGCRRKSSDRRDT